MKASRSDSKKSVSALEKPISKKLIWIFSTLSSCVFFSTTILYFKVWQPDLDEHILISEGMFENGKVPAHPLFYFFIQFFSFFSKNFRLEVFAGFLVFSAAQTMKIIASSDLVESISRRKMTWIGFLVVFCSCWVITPGIFEEHFIINQIVPNYFHNGTLHLSIPFSLWLLRKIYLFVELNEERRIRQIIQLGIIAGLCKPSILFCLIPLFPAYVYLRKGISGQLLGALQVSLLFSFLLIGQSLYLRLNPPNYISSFKIEFRPFFQFGSLWYHFKVLVYSLFLPLLLFIAGWPKSRNPFILFLALCHFLGLIITFTLVDSINGIKFNNMTWQSSVTLLLLLVSTGGLVFQSEKIGMKAKLSLLLLFMGYMAYTAQYFFHVIVYRSFFL